MRINGGIVHIVMILLVGCLVEPIGIINSAYLNLVAADDDTRRVPKDNQRETLEQPPALPPSEISRPSPDEGTNTPPPTRNETKHPPVQEPIFNDDHCKGSSDCSTGFDGGTK